MLNKTEAEYNKDIVMTEIEEKLEAIWYYPWNRDWEFSENQYYQTAEDVYWDIQWEQPINIYKYIEEWMVSMHEFEIDKDKLLFNKWKQWLM